ncbi:hypothetical protein Mapa_007886 [Marchantia paleacea]|nr:hypothetical protein Mapa_007886 [Marchantia paleacea]
MNKVEIVISCFSVTCVIVVVCLAIWFLLGQLCIDRRVVAARNKSEEMHGGGSAGEIETRQNGRGKSVDGHDLEAGTGKDHLHGGS